MRKKCCTALLLLGLLLGIHNGYVALWDTGNSLPVKVFPYRVESYPASDQQALKNGIPVRDPEQLRQLLEDLTS